MPLTRSAPPRRCRHHSAAGGGDASDRLGASASRPAIAHPAPCAEKSGSITHNIGNDGNIFFLIWVAFPCDLNRGIDEREAVATRAGMKTRRVR